MKIFSNFTEVEQEIRETVQPVVYKFRTWEGDYHKRIITNREAWFAHPHTLNDPYDLRPPYNFIAEDIDWNEAKNRMIEAGRVKEPNLSEVDLEKEVELRLRSFKEDPVAYFQRTRGEYIVEEAHYDQIGVFSCCTSCENEPMWAHYGNNHCGFAVGFNTVELCKSLNCTVGYVRYSDKPIDYYILGNNEGIMNEEMFQKSTRWTSEKELRFITVGIGKYRNRAVEFPLEAVSEIVFGMNTTDEIKENIIGKANVTLPGISFYRVEFNPDAYGFKKVKI